MGLHCVLPFHLLSPVSQLLSNSASAALLTICGSVAGAARPTHMAWNCRELQGVLLGSPAFAVFFCGHDHMGGYAEINGRHFITLEAMLEGAHCVR